MEVYGYLAISVILTLPTILFCCCSKKEPFFNMESNACEPTAFEVKYEPLLK